MCRKFGIPRSLVYYKRKTRKNDSKLENAVISIFNASNSNYGSRKLNMNNTFNDLDEHKFKLADYVHWFNNIRIHGSLGYLSPVQFKKLHPAK